MYVNVHSTFNRVLLLIAGIKNKDVSSPIVAWKSDAKVAIAVRTLMVGQEIKSKMYRCLLESALRS